MLGVTDGEGNTLAMIQGANGKNYTEIKPDIVNCEAYRYSGRDLAVFLLNTCSGTCIKQPSLQLPFTHQ